MTDGKTRAMIEGIRHLGMVVHDLQQSIDFYQHYFGFSIEKDADEKGAFIEEVLSLPSACLRTVKMKSPASEVMIELISFVDGEVLENDNRINQVGPTHFAVTVCNLDSKYKSMNQQGVEFLSAPKKSPDNYAKVAFCRAPEGTYIEMVELLVE